YAHVIFFDEMFIKRDISRYYYPLRKLIRQQFESGIFPFWNPYLFCGIPLFATLQNCVLYPLSIIYYLGDFSEMFDFFILLHLFLAAFFMYLLMKELGLSKLASFLASFSFAFSGYMISAINLAISLSSAAWFPLVLYFYKKGLTEDSAQRLKWIVFSALALVMMFLAGDPAIVYISLLILFFISLYFFFEDAIEKKKFSSNHLKPFFITAVLFILLSLFQILPFLEFVVQTERKGMPWWVASGWSVPVTDLISLIIPFFNDINWYFGDYWQVQSWLDNYYMGLIPLCFCFIGIFFDKSKKSRLLILLSIFSLAIVLGKYSAFYAFLYEFVPLFRLIRYPVRFFFLIAFCLAALAGIGLDYFRNNIQSNAKLQKFARRLLIISFLSVIVLGLTISFSGTIFAKLWNTILSMIQGQDPSKDIADLNSYISMAFYNFKRAVALFVIFGFLFFLGAKKYAMIRAFCLGFIGIALCDILSTNLKYEATMDAKIYNMPSGNINFLQKDKSLFRVAVSPQIGRWHTRLPEKSYIEGILASKDRLVPNKMVEYGIYDISGYDSMYLIRHSRLLNVIAKLNAPNEARILDMLNVKYICTQKMDEKKGYRLVNKTPLAYLFENLNWLPRAYLAEKGIVIKNEDKIIARLKSKAFNPTKEVILEEAGDWKLEVGTTETNSKFITDKVEIISYKANEVIIKAMVSSPKFLILADSYYPGWKVYVNGRRDKIYRADYILRAVYLKKSGQYLVKFRYEPRIFELAAGISLATLVLAGMICKYKFLC
ncbi:MAG: YfhO family protein, partial [Candidatus Omnitrophica bacterium]|nr:YfhO family protein [Candidatus Omnitrophota bacterium]